MSKKKYDFGGWATKHGVRCMDGRTIQHGAFREMDGSEVPIIWQHKHGDPNSVLGHALLEEKEEGVYAYGLFNETDAGKRAKEFVKHGDIKNLSIYANSLVQKGPNVVHGAIREVSLVVTGANPEARIENVSIEHSGDMYDEPQVIEDEAIIHSGERIVIDLEEDEQALEHASEDQTVEEVINTLDDTQKEVVYSLIAEAVESSQASEDEDDNTDEDVEHSGGDERMKKNVFQQELEHSSHKRPRLKREQLDTILADAQKCGSYKDAFLAHAGDYGIDDIDILFPDAKLVTNPPDFIKRKTEWVSGVLNGVKHSPFSRIKSVAADITADEARAKGYITGNEKKEEVIKLLSRKTYPQTIYKKQKLDRDDILDITDLDVVAWLKAEMRMMLDEELARAILIGDGRTVGDPDKINEENIRSIYKDDDLYAHHIELSDGITMMEKVDEIIKARIPYKGTGTPTMYTTEEKLIDMLLMRDNNGLRLYRNEADLASELRVSAIVAVEVMEGTTRVNDDGDTLELEAILVNLPDYTVGADKGGEVTFFDDFDIDFNQYKYLLETRVSGALTHPKSAVVIETKKTA